MRVLPALLVATVLAGIAALAGCGGDPAPRQKPAARVEPAVTISVRRITFDGQPRGFLKVKTSATEANRPGREGEALTHWVYDERLTPVGWFTTGGHTYRLNRRGESTDLGMLPTEIALRLLLKAPSDAAVDFLPIDPPRTIEGDAEAARAAAAKAKAAAAGAPGEGEAPPPKSE